MTDQELIQALRGAAVETGSPLCLGCGYEHSCTVHGCAILRAAAERLEELTAPPPNDPLTLEELREMDGEPVWIVGISCINHFKGHWDICEWENGEVVNFPHCMESPDIMLLGHTWLAYRRKPEEPPEVCAATGKPCCRCQPGACNSRRVEEGTA